MPVAERPVLVAPDSFKGTFSAPAVAGAIGRGLERAGLMPPDLCPVADGGEGTLDALLPQLGGELLAAELRQQRVERAFAAVGDRAQVRWHQPGALEPATDRPGDLRRSERALEGVRGHEDRSLGEGHRRIVSDVRDTGFGLPTFNDRR